MKGFIKTVSAAALSLLPFVASAVAINPNVVPNTPINSIGGAFNLICTVFGWLFWLFIILTVFFILLAAFKYLTAGGEPEKVKGANYLLIYAAIGIVVALIAKAFPAIVYTFTGGTGTLQGC